MKRVNIQIDYHTHWGESIHILGNVSELGNGKMEEAKALRYVSGATWTISIDVPKSIAAIRFRFLIKENDQITRTECGQEHIAYLNNYHSHIFCMWQGEPKQKYLTSSLFRNSVFKHSPKEIVAKDVKDIQFIVHCVHIKTSQELVISGANECMGKWTPQKTISGIPIAYGKWLFSFDRAEIDKPADYKFAIKNKSTQEIMEWEEGENRTLDPLLCNSSLTQELQYQKDWVNWKASGLAIPIFSLRSKKSFGIGDFSDLNLLVDWAKKTKMTVIQVLPINDTTASYTWLDSYPYNAISIYALHPIYLGLSSHPLNDKEKNEKYKKEAQKLNKLGDIDYEQVIAMKTSYINHLFDEKGDVMLLSKAYKQFYDKNKTWLFPYACFCYLRDKYGTSNMGNWGQFAKYNAKKLEKFVAGDKNIERTISKVYFTQYLLHEQLTAAKEYAYTNGLVLKGDIPIGISPHSVEAWTEPHLFKLDCQTGAPPDDFSVNGQNWKFPTYHWEEMKKDGYGWWVKRFQKMADYFDAYRIDHILGFFRIWEIPTTAVHGLLGYFSPAMPLSADELAAWGITTDVQLAVVPAIHQLDIACIFDSNYLDASKEFLKQEGDFFCLKPAFDNQQKIKDWFEAKKENLNNPLRDRLYELCNEVLFIKDKYEINKYHPRIGLQNSFAYKRLNDAEKLAINKLYDHYFYHRHSAFWREEAMSKLPTLIGATDMLVCGEDLGMVPESVPSVMHDLQILSLEIERMPKQLGLRFVDLNGLPYLSVVTTSTHDMAPVRLWWEENEASTQDYYNTSLHLEGYAPKTCNTVVAQQIIKKHLQSPAMLTIFPLQDWLAMSDKWKKNDPREERINVPSNPQHNWKYRMYLTLEELMKDAEFAAMITRLNEESGR